MTTKNDLFDEENRAESNWFKFEKVGDTVSGIVVELGDKEASGNFPAQKVWTLKQEDGELINVGVAVHKTYVVSRANTAAMGDELGFKFVKEVPSAKNGHAPAKSIEVFVRHSAGESISADEIMDAM